MVYEPLSRLTGRGDGQRRAEGEPEGTQVENLCYGTVEQVFNLLSTRHRLPTCATRRLPLGEALAVDSTKDSPVNGTSAPVFRLMSDS